MEVVLYSTDCPKCRILKKKLEQAQVKYIENNSVDEMREMGIEQVPMLLINRMLLDFKAANDWVNEIILKKG